MKRILCLFDYGRKTATGYSTVSKNIVSELKKHFGDRLHLDIIGINNFEEQYWEYDDTVMVLSALKHQPVPVIEGQPSELEQGDPYGRILFLHMVQNKDYDGLFIIQDLGNIAAMIPALRYRLEIGINSPSIKSILYFPVDGILKTRVKNESWDPENMNSIAKEHRHFFDGKEYIQQLDELDFFTAIVTYTEYGFNEIVRHRPSLKERVCICNHGINTKEFYPLPADQKVSFRKKYFGDNSKKFIVGCINRNDHRKDIPTAILGFIEATKTWPEGLPKPFLYLHCDPEDQNEHSHRLYKVLAQTNLLEGRDYMFPKEKFCDTETMNKIVNSIDVYVSTSRGEGWGLNATEAMACKVPVIMPDNTAMSEICGQGERAFMLEEGLPIVATNDNTIRYMCHYEEVAEKIIQVAQLQKMENETGKQDLRSIAIENAYDWITDRTWQKQCEEFWNPLFEMVFFNKK